MNILKKVLSLFTAKKQERLTVNLNMTNPVITESALKDLTASFERIKDETWITH